MKIFNYLLLITFCLLLTAYYFLLSNIVLASTTDGTIDSTYKYAWSENAGWINFGTSGGNVHITDSVLTGYAWSDNYGWINLAPTTSGVTNNNEGTLSGYAWGENLGWINFSGVTINSSGVFAGSASGDISGGVSFDCTNCTVKTDWRPASTRTTTPSVGAGGLPSAAYTPPTPPETGFKIIINDDAPETDINLVTIYLIAGPDTKYVELSEDPYFRGFVTLQPGETDYRREEFETIKKYILTPDEGPKTIYARFYGPYLQTPSEVVSDSIVLKYKKAEAPPSLISRLPEILQPFIPEFLKPKPPKVKPPEIPLEELLPKEAPLSLKSRWLLLDPKAIGRLVFVPLPKDFRILVQKFPQLEETFIKVGITRMTELLKLRTAKLTLPGVREIVGLPTEIVFARTGGGMVDFNITLTLTEKGKAQQKIATISGKPLELVVKPEKPVKAIKGYIVFRSQKPQPDSSLRVPLNSLTASLFFAKPVFAQTRIQPVEVEEKLVLLEFEYTDPDGDGIYTAEISMPVVDGEYEIITVMDYEDPALGMKEIRLITVVDPEGYIYEKTDGRETRLPGAVVSLYWLNPETKQYELWPAKRYQQENPQTSDITGKYSFIVPEGFYYLKVETPGFLSYDGKPFQVTEGSGVHINIELKTKYWWLKVLDYKIIILVLVLILLGYNFYRDRVRERLLKKEIIK